MHISNASRISLKGDLAKQSFFLLKSEKKFKQDKKAESELFPVGMVQTVLLWCSL